MTRAGIRAALGAALLVAGTSLAVVGAMATRSTGDAAGTPTAQQIAEAAPAPPGEVAALSEALGKHLPSDATVVAWQDISRELHLPEDTSASYGWTDALLAPVDEGIRQLRDHAGNHPVHLVVHVRDTLLLGALAPTRIGVAFQDKTDSGDMHGSINGAREWVRTEGFAAYTAYRLGDSSLRLVALTDDASMDTLLAQLLPFHNPRHEREPVPGLTLVHQVGGFWVYRLEPDQG